MSNPTDVPERKRGGNKRLREEINVAVYSSISLVKEACVKSRKVLLLISLVFKNSFGYSPLRREMRTRSQVLHREQN